MRWLATPWCLRQIDDGEVYDYHAAGPIGPCRNRSLIMLERQFDNLEDAQAFLTEMAAGSDAPDAIIKVRDNPEFKQIH
jgi:hypothetical protein